MICLSPIRAGRAAALMLVPALLMLATGNTHAQIPDNAGLDEYLAYAAMHHPGLLAARADGEAAAQVGFQVRALPDPLLVLTRRSMERVAGLGLSQQFPLFGKRSLSGQMADRSARSADAVTEARGLQVYADVVQAYAAYAYLHQAMALTEENLALLKQMEQVALSRYRTGEAPFADVVRSQVEVGLIEEALRSLHDSHPAVTAHLNAAIGRSAEASLPPPQPLSPIDLDLRQEQVLAAVRTSNPDLEALRHQTEVSRLAIEVARRQYLPDLMIGIDYMRTFDGMDDGWAAMATINLPVVRGRLQGRVAEAAARSRGAEQRQTMTVQSAEAEVQAVLSGYRDARRKIVLYRDQLRPLVGESYQASLAAYRAAEVPFQDLMEVARRLLEFDLTLARAISEQRAYLARLEMLMGRRLNP